MRKSVLTVPALLSLGLLLSLGVAPANAVSAADVTTPVNLMPGERSFVSTDPASGTSLVVAADSSDIVGQLFDADFTALGASFMISQPGPDYETPSATWNAEDSQWIIVWHNDSGSSEVNGRILALNGTFVTPQLLIADEDLNGETFQDSELVFASYAPDQDGYLVAFKTTLTPSSCQTALVSWVGADGTVPTTAATPVSSDNPAVLCNDIDNGADLAYSTADSEWIVTWYDSANDVTMIRRVGTGATPTMLGAPVTVGPNENGGSASIVYDPSRNRVLVGWNNDSTDGLDALGAFVSATDVVTPTVIATGSTTLDWRKPRLVYASATDQFFAALHDNDEQAVYLVQIDAASGIAEAPLRLAGPAMVRPSISTDGTCLWVVWDDQADDDIRGTTTCLAVAPAAQLAETGQDSSLLAAGAVLALLLVGAGVAAKRRSSVKLR